MKRKTLHHLSIVFVLFFVAVVLLLPLTLFTSITNSWKFWQVNKIILLAVIIVYKNIIAVAKSGLKLVSKNHQSENSY